MRRIFAVLAIVLGLSPLTSFASNLINDPTAAPTPKEWTFLIYLNGNNNLDSYGAMNLNLAEKVGSSDQVNVVVQWASQQTGKVQRILIKKDADSTNVTSPVVQDLGHADMGDWKTLVDFVKWGAQKYPAKHYFLDLWDHGSGWHPLPAGAPQAMGARNMHPFDISWDDTTGNHITTAQLGDAMREIAKGLGQKLDILGTDACLMAMAEVGQEVADSVSYLAASEEVEPAEGWPYDQLLAKWTAKPTMTAAEVGKVLAHEYVAAYKDGGEYGKSDVQFSMIDLGKLPAFNAAVSDLAKHVLSLSTDGRSAVKTSMQNTQSFAYSDYGDVIDFMTALEGQGIQGLATTAVTAVRTAATSAVVANEGTAAYAKAHGMAMWLPTYSYYYTQYADSYKALSFDKATHWGDVLAQLAQ